VEPLSTEGQIVVEERINKPNGEAVVTQFVRGNFLGKVGADSYLLGRVRQVLRVHSGERQADICREIDFKVLADQEQGETEGTMTFRFTSISCNLR